MRKREQIFKNGMLNENRMLMLKKIAEIVSGNQGKCILSQDQIISVYEEVVELKSINELVFI